MSYKLGLALTCALNFAAGVGIGVSVDRRCGPHHGPKDGGPHGGMSRSLGLDADQEPVVRAILDKHRPEFDAVRAEEAAKLAAVRDATDAELKTVLRPEQYARLLEMRKDFERHEREGPPR
ncbi:MAG TPA: periplasmic heavy metal sensor [Planctomycetota bacterium]|nr:periplasmic heavy metal sensor [Planctomycetota bacterium]